MCVFGCVVQVAREPYSDRLWDTGKKTHAWLSLREQQRRATSSSPTGRVGKCVCESHNWVCVSVCCMFKWFHSRMSLTLSGRNHVCLSCSCGACAFLLYFTEPFFFKLFLIYRLNVFLSSSSVLFHCSTAPGYLCCVPIKGFACVCGPSCLDLAIALFFTEEIPGDFVTVFTTGLVTWKYGFYSLTKAPCRCFHGVSEVQTSLFDKSEPWNQCWHHIAVFPCRNRVFDLLK